jgi:hypothetical protein
VSSESFKQIRQVCGVRASTIVEEVCGVHAEPHFLVAGGPRDSWSQQCHQGP